MISMLHIPDPPTQCITIALSFNWSCSEYSMREYDPEMPSNSVSEDLFSKFSWGWGMPPSISMHMLCMLIVLHTITKFSSLHTQLYSCMAWPPKNCFLQPWFMKQYNWFLHHYFIIDSAIFWAKGFFSMELWMSRFWCFQQLLLHSSTQRFLPTIW